MAVKSIIDIDVNDERFKEFLALFEKYQVELGQVGGKWRATEKAADGVAESISEMTAAMMAQVDLLNKENRERADGRRAEADAAKKQRDMEKETSRITAERGRHMKKMAADAKSVAVSVGRAAGTLLKWGGILGAGLIGGGLWGLGRLAAGAGDARREAMGLGTTTGAMQAFGINYGRAIDTSGNLSAIAQAQGSISERWRFAAMGINPTGRDPVELAAEMLPRALELYRKGGRTQEYAQAVGLDKFYSMDELRRVDRMSPEELAGMQARMRSDAQALKVQDAVSEKWQRLSEQSSRAGLQIKTAFIDGLEPLAPKFAELSSGLARFISGVLKSDRFEKFIDMAADGLAKLATYVGDGSLAEDMAAIGEKALTLARDLGDAATAIKGGIRAIREWIPGTEEYKAMKERQWAEAPRWYRDPLGAVKDWGASFVKPITEARVNSIARMASQPSKYDAQFQVSAAKYGVDWRELKLRAATESNLNPDAVGPATKYGQAIGIMQVNARAHGLSRSAMLDPAANIDAGAKIWADAMRRAGGDPQRAAAIYYGSPGKPNSEQYAENDAAVRRKLGLGVAAVSPRAVNENAPLTAAEQQALAYTMRGQPRGSATQVDVKVSAPAGMSTAVSVNGASR